MHKIASPFGSFEKKKSSILMLMCRKKDVFFKRAMEVSIAPSVVKEQRYLKTMYKSDLN